MSRYLEGAPLSLAEAASADPAVMKDMLQFLIARDTMHQQQWLAVIEELGFAEQLPIPNTHPLDEEHREFSYVFLDPGWATRRRCRAASPKARRWTAEANSASGPRSRTGESLCSRRPTRAAAPRPSSSGPRRPHRPEPGGARKRDSPWVGR